jgi:hypothetical protein
VAHHRRQVILILAKLKQLRVDVHVLAAGRESIERLAVHEVKLHLLRKHPIPILILEMARRADLLAIRLLRHLDDPIPHLLDVIRQLPIPDDGRLQPTMRLIRLIDDLPIGHRASPHQHQQQRSAGSHSHSHGQFLV